MYRLYLDSSNSFLTVIIVKDNEVLESYSESSFRRHTELLLPVINEKLKKLNISLKDIDEIIITNGPGSYTGVRVAVTFVKTLVVLSPKIKVFVLNSLLLQVGLKKAISIITGYNNKSYLAAYDQGQEIIRTQLVTDVAKQGMIEDLQGYDVIENFQSVDSIANFLSLKNKAKKINKIEELKPIYEGDNFN